MNVTRKKLVLLSCALAICVTATLCLLFVGRESTDAAQEDIYYFTNYNTPDALMAASVENESGSIVLVQTGSTCYAASDLKVGSDVPAIKAFFESAYRLPLKQLVEGASASDSQYGLTDPRATILLQDLGQGGVLFYLGGAAPGGEGVYTCLSGDERVFILDNTYAEMFLSNINRFLSLALYPTLEGAAVQELTGIEVRHVGETAYRLRQVMASENGSTAYFALESPWQLLLGANQTKSALLTPLRQLEGIAVVDASAEACGLTPESDSFRLRYRDGSSITVFVGSRDGENTCVTAEGSEYVFLVPTASLAFMDMTAEDVIGRNLLDLNINDIDRLTLNGSVYDVESGSGLLQISKDGEIQDTADFQNTVFAALNRISIGGTYREDQSIGAELLRVSIATNLMGEKIELSFHQMDGRRCAVAINGQLAVWCDLTAVDALLDAVS